MADSGNAELLALLAEMKKCMEAGQERLEREIHSGQERMDEIKKGQAELIVGQKKLLQEMEAFVEEMNTGYEDMKVRISMKREPDEEGQSAVRKSMKREPDEDGPSEVSKSYEREPDEKKKEGPSAGKGN
ncbi:hypothetical protein HNY73_005979 [Argiope bruennichi]|uniref:Uncharacterized protein n=1 Tax=Argiope bruennichi TaxID=94029 RepID=A0A8T0FN90_ARGBR|nr:hypothetical protein HNY73_005979 [Argiope bruennichi]